MSLHKISSAIQVLSGTVNDVITSLGPELAKRRGDFEWTDPSGETKPCL
jgi:hypothetical protein